MLSLLAAALVGGAAILSPQVYSSEYEDFNPSNTIKLIAGNYTSSIDCEGELDAASGTPVLVSGNGVVAEVFVANEDEVSAGKTLLLIEDPDKKKAVDDAQAAADEAESAKQDAQGVYDSAEATLTTAIAARDKAISGAQSLPTGNEQETSNQDPAQLAQEVTDAEKALSAAEKALDDATAQAVAAQEKLTQAQQDVQPQEVVSPVDGTVAELEVAAGMTCAEVEKNGPALRVIDPSTMVAKAYVPGGSLQSVSRGNFCQVDIEGVEDGEGMNATISDVSYEPVSASERPLRYEVTITLDSLPEGVSDGMKVTAHIPIQDYGTVFYVPESAVGEDETGYYVVTVGDRTAGDKGTLRHRGVEVVGKSDDGRIVIRSSVVKEGTRIRTDLA